MSFKKYNQKLAILFALCLLLTAQKLVATLHIEQQTPEEPDPPLQSVQPPQQETPAPPPVSPPSEAQPPEPPDTNNPEAQPPEDHGTPLQPNNPPQQPLETNSIVKFQTN